MSLRIPLCVTLLAATLLQASRLAGAEFGNVPRTKQHVDMVLPPELDSTAVAAQTPEYDYWTVQVTLNGQKLRLVVDTGAEATFLSPKAAMKCGLKDAFGHGFESPPIAEIEAAIEKLAITGASDALFMIYDEEEQNRAKGSRACHEL